MEHILTINYSGIEINFYTMIQEKIIDTAKVVGANGVATGITISNVNETLTMMSIILAISYSLWKWRRDYKRGDKK